MGLKNEKIAAVLLALAGALSIFAAEGGGEMSLLSDNVRKNGKSKLFPKEISVIETGAEHSFVVTGEFATCKGSLESAAPNGGVKVLFDGAEWWKSQTYGDWDKGKWVTVLVDLKKPYLVGKVSFRAIRDAQRDTKCGVVLLSLDGNVFTQYGVAQNTADLPGEKKFVEHSCELSTSVLARYVELRMEKTRHQQQISEVAVYGRETGGADVRQYLQAGMKPAVGFEARAIQDGAALLSWKGFQSEAAGVKQWRVYCSDKPFVRMDEAGVRLAKQCGAKQLSAAVYPFEPGSTVYFGVAAVYAEGENATVKSIPVRFKKPYERNTFGDMLGINHYLGGGASGRGAPWSDVSLELLAEMPFRENRWWFMFPETVKRFLDQGVGMITWPNIAADSAKHNIRNANGLGLHSFTKGNEPELKGLTPAAYLESLKKELAEARRMSPWNTIAAPTCNIWPTALEWLEGFYAVGAKGHFDVLDLHTYVKTPELLFERMECVRAILRKYGDENRPMISSEFGYADTPQGVEGVSPLTKAQYLVRGLVIHYALGFKRVYLYSFMDVGTDPNYNEHHFGLLDYDLQKKPAYYAVRNLGRQLAEADLLGAVPGMTDTSYGYQFKDVGANRHSAVVWDSAQEQMGVFKVKSERVEVVDLMGGTRSAVPDGDGVIQLAFGASPVYIKSDQPVVLVSKRVSEASARQAADVQQMAVVLKSKHLIAPADTKTAAVEMSLANGTGRTIEGDVRIVDDSGKNVGGQQVLISAGSNAVLQVAVGLPETSETALFRYTLQFLYKTASGSFAEERPFVVRRLVALGDKPRVTRKVRFQGLDDVVYCVANAGIEVSVVPGFGGRVVELIDRKTLTHQLHLDYEAIADRKHFPLSYGMWWAVGKQRFASDWAVKEAADGNLVIGHEDEKIALQFVWNVDAAAGKIRLDASVRNKLQVDEQIVLHLHPEYQLAGGAESGIDILRFPTAEGIYKLPFWIDLGERPIPALTENWWSVQDEVANLSMKQTFANGWETPRIWFGGGFFNTEMNWKTTLAPNATGTTWLDWELMRK